MDDSLIETSAVKEEEPYQILESFIDKGIELYNQGKYQEAMDWLYDEQIGIRVGTPISNGSSCMILRSAPSSSESIHGKLVEIYALSYFSTYADNPSLHITRLDAMVDFETGERLFEIPEVMLQNVALNHLEEWCHALQYLKGNKNLTSETDIEDDVTKYLEDRGVKVTEFFKNRRKPKNRVADEVEAKDEKI